MSAVDLRPLVHQLADDLATVPARIADAYADGVAEGIARGIRIGAEQAEREMAEQWARVRDLVLETASPRSRTYAERRAAEVERVRTGSQATGPELVERARKSWAHLANRPQRTAPPAGLPHITWDGTYRPMRPDAVWTATDEYRYRAHLRDSKSGGKAA